MSGFNNQEIHYFSFVYMFGFSNQENQIFGIFIRRTIQAVFFVRNQFLCLDLEIETQ